MARKPDIEITHYINRLDPNDESDHRMMRSLARQAFEMDMTGKTRCGCGKRISAVNSFRCVYCGQFFCVQCAEIHFGLTREDYDKTR